MHTFDETTLQALRADLLIRAADLLGEISSAREIDLAAADATGIATTDVNDFKDMASQHERAALRDAEVERDRNELADVRAALARLSAGTYGICIDCQQKLDLKRLTAIPAAARCVACQTQLESRAV